jgi:hypothetical protein
MMSSIANRIQALSKKVNGKEDIKGQNPSKCMSILVQNDDERLQSIDVQTFQTEYIT